MSLPFEALMRTEALTFGLEAARLSGLLIAAPLAWTFLPARARAGLVLLLTFFMHGVVPRPDLEAVDILHLSGLTASEFLVGIALGFVARLVLATTEIAADAIAPTMGLSAAQLVDPSLGGQGTVLTKLLRYFGILFALSAGLHHMLLAAVFHSFSVFPIGSMIHPELLAEDMIDLTARALSSGVRLALPILAILFIAQIALAFVARAAPAMQIFAIGFAVTLGTGAVLWVAFAPEIAGALTELARGAEPTLLRVLSHLAGNAAR